MSSSEQQNSQSASVSENESILMEYFSRGMRNASSSANKQMIAEISVKTGLSSKQIQNWIAYRYQKERVQQGIAPPRKRTRGIPKRTLSGRNVFYKETLAELKDLNQQEKMKEAAARWRSIVGTDLESHYKKMAMDIPSPDMSQLSKPQINKHATFLYKRITKLLKQLEEIGDETYLMSYNTRTQLSYECGTDRGRAFGKGMPNLIAQFMTFVASSPNTANVLEEEENNLRSAVTNLFNSLYEKATGKKHCSYKAINNGHVIVSGMPEGIDFKKPKSYGIPKLKCILNSASDIKMTRVVLSVPETSVASAPVPETAVGRVPVPVAAISRAPVSLPAEIVETTVGHAPLPVAAVGSAPDPETVVGRAPVSLPAEMVETAVGRAPVPLTAVGSAPVPVPPEIAETAVGHICHKCLVKFGSAKDKRLKQKWLNCQQCKVWYHRNCSRRMGHLLKDGSFVCSGCL